MVPALVRVGESRQHPGHLGDPIVAVDGPHRGGLAHQRSTTKCRSAKAAT